MNTSELKLEWYRRQGGGGATEREYLNYIIDGKPISGHLKSEESDYIGRLGWMPKQEHNFGIEHLLLNRPPDSPSGRVILIVCPECGDVGCGVFSARIEKNMEFFIWSDFVYENNYENAPAETFPDVGPFYFNKASYFAELNRHKEK